MCIFRRVKYKNIQLNLRDFASTKNMFMILKLKELKQDSIKNVKRIIKLFITYCEYKFLQIYPFR